MKKKHILVVLFMLCAFILTACFSKKLSLSEENSIIALKSNGKWQSLLVQDYDKRILAIDEKELKAFVEKEVEEFNKSSKDVKLVGIKVDESKVKLLFEYTSFEKLLEYTKYSNDDSINFHNVEIFDIKDFKDSAYAKEISEEISKGKKVLVLEGVGRFYSENKISKAIAIGTRETKLIDSHHLEIEAGKNEKHTDAKTVIVID